MVTYTLERGLFVMSIDRKKQRENRRKKRISLAIEKRLELNNEFGIKDPTPFEAINQIIRKDKRRSESNEK